MPARGRGRRPACPFALAEASLHLGRAGGPGVRSPAHARGRTSQHSKLAGINQMVAWKFCSNREWACARTPEPPTLRGAVSLTGKSLLHPPAYSLRRVVRTCGRRPIRGCYGASVPTSTLTPGCWPTRADARERAPENASSTGRRREVVARNVTNARPPLPSRGARLKRQERKNL